MKYYMGLLILLFSMGASGQQLVESSATKDRGVISSVKLTPDDFSTGVSQITFDNVVYDISSPKIARVTDQHYIEFKFEVSIENTKHTETISEEARRINEQNNTGRLRRIIGVSPVLHKISIDLRIPVSESHRALNCRDLTCRSNGYVLKKWFEEVPPELSKVYRNITKVQAIELRSILYENATGVFHYLIVEVVEYTTYNAIETISRPNAGIGN